MSDTTVQQAVEEIDNARKVADQAMGVLKESLKQINTSVDDAFSAMAEEAAMKG